ncbi:MAG: ParB/RepB/Spo0J family partition protein [Sulfuricaulis sp.]
MPEDNKSKRTRLLESVKHAISDSEGGSNTEAEPGGRGVLTSRVESVNRAGVQQKERRTFLRIPPDRCLVWHGNPRQQHLLNETTCADLINGFTARGQDFAAIVRPVSGDPDHDFEVIVGSRRRWTAEHLNMLLLVEVREQLNDEEAYAVSHSENDDRLSVSDYEDALGMKRALGSFYHGQVSYQAQRMGKSVDYISRFLDLAELPEEVVDAYPSLFEIKVGHMRMLKPLFDNPRSRKRVIELAESIKGKFATGAKLVNFLLTADKPRKTPPKVFEVKTGTNKPLVSAKYKRGRVSINISLKTGASDTEVSKALRRTLEWAQGQAK